MSLNTLIQTFSPSVSQLFQAMIPSFQQGYVDYVYQTENPDTQRRRIKQLEKTFKKLLTEPYYYLQRLDENDSSHWKQELQLELVDLRQEALSGHYKKIEDIQIIRNGACIGLAVLGYLGNALEFSMDLKDSFLDQLQIVYSHLEQELQKNSDLTEVKLLLSTLRKDKLALYQDLGFHLLQNDQCKAAISLIKSLDKSI